VSNLSELLPAGGGGKNVKFVANGILPNGQAVVLKSNGQVEAVSISGLAESIPAGSESVFNSGSSNYKSISFDPNNSGKFVISYNDQGNSNYGTAIVGTISGTSISFGSEYVFDTGYSVFTSVSFDPNNSGKFVVCYRNLTNSSYGTACVGTVSGTSISFGSKYIFNSSTTNYVNAAFDPNTAGKFVVCYGATDAARGKAIVGTVSGTSISFGSESVFNAANIEYPFLSFDPNNSGKFVIGYQDQGNSAYGTAIIGTISGTSISYGSESVFNSANTRNVSLSFDPDTSGKFVVVYHDNGNNYYGTAIVGTVSGTSISYGSESVFNSANTGETSISFYTNNSGKFVACYRDGGNSNYGTAIVGTISGTSISFGSESVFNSGSTNYLSSSFDPNNSGKFVVCYRDGGNSNYGTAIVGQVSTLGTNLTSTNFLGITDDAIASGAAGKVTIKGGLKTELAGGTFAVTVANPGSGNRYYINGVLQYTLNLREGFTYKFDQSASSNSNHPFRFSTTSNGSHASGSEYTTGVTTSGTPGNAGAYTQIVVAASAPTLYYYCTNHSGMGGTANTLAAIVPNSVYYVQGDGTLSTTTTSPAVRIGKALSSTSINLEFNS